MRHLNVLPSRVASAARILLQFVGDERMTRAPKSLRAENRRGFEGGMRQRLTRIPVRI